MRLVDLKTQALRYLALGEPEKALLVYRGILLQAPTDLDSRMRVADVLAQIGQHHLACRVYAAVAWCDLQAGRPLHALVQEIAYDIQPGDNTPAPAKTTVRIGYTSDAIYFAFHATDPDPSQIRAHLRDRDAAFNDDWVGVFMDTFNDNRRGYELIVNPYGVQADLIRDETNTNNQEDASWDGLWESAGQLTAEGYDVEIRIPFSTLRFPTGGGEQTWGISLFRNWPRDKRHQLTSHKVPRESNCFQCEWGKYQGMAGAQQGRDLKTVYRETMDAVRPKYGHWVIFDHCMPFDVTRAYDEATQYRDPRIWTAERDVEMWKALES